MSCSDSQSPPSPPTKRRHPAFPMSFVTTGRCLLLVGGGDLGASRLATALDFDWQRILFVEANPVPLTKELAASDERVELRERDVQEHDVEGADLVIESTMDDTLAETVANWCRARRIPFNAMDKLEWCDVYYSALIERGPLLLSITSGGESPALAALLRRTLSDRMGPGWCNAALLMAETRRSLPRTPARMKMLKAVSEDEGFLNALAENDINAMRRHLDDAVRRMSM